MAFTGKTGPLLRCLGMGKRAEELRAFNAVGFDDNLFVGQPHQNIFTCSRRSSMTGKSSGADTAVTRGKCFSRISR